MYTVVKSTVPLLFYYYDRVSIFMIVTIALKTKKERLEC